MEQLLDRVVEPSGGTPKGGPSGPAKPAMPTPGSTALGKEPTMSSSMSPEETPAALVGSLSVFTLSDVLLLLATTRQTGEVRVVGEGVDGRLWLSDGSLSNAHVGAATTIGQAVFELACATGGWLHFTAGIVSSSGQPAVPVAAVLNEVRPQVEEWREIRRAIPLEAVVTLSPSPPGHDVQIRSDQWQVLTAVGSSGHTVNAVLDKIGGDKIMGLRTLRDLRAAGLIALVPVASEDGSHAEDAAPMADAVADPTALPPPPTSGLPPEYADDAVDPGSPPPGAAPESDREDVRVSSLAEVAAMPTPTSDDPWAAIAGPDDARHNGVA